jgi:REP element-mobilizing transposase RayT
MPITLYALLTWTTRDRAPIIDAAGAAFLRTFLPRAAELHRAQVIGMAIVRDHVHLLLYLDGLVNIPQLVQRLKGASARIANRDSVLGDVRLRWARGYDLRSVSPRAVPAAQAYLARQAVRHPGLAIPGTNGEADPTDSTPAPGSVVGG